MLFFRPLHPFALLVAIIIVILAASPLTLQAQGKGAANNTLVRTLTLSASGTVNSKPDMATISTGVETEAVKARDALDDNNDIMARMMKSLTQAGLEARDIATTQFSVQPRYQHFKNGRSARVIGYRVTNSLRITVRQLDDLGGILDRLVTLGSNRINAIQFALSNPDKARDEARVNAMGKVIHKAKLYAKAAGVTLGAITSISEQSNRFAPRPVAYMAKRAMASVPIAPGQQTTTVTVHVKWTLND